MNRLLLKTAFVFTCLLLATGSLCAQQPARPQVPAPTHANVKYGPHERNVFDLWLPESKTPTPLVIFIHGGGFSGGDKANIGTGMLRYLQSGWAVAALNYRFISTDPAPAAYLDCGRALQFLRHHAKDWNLNPKLVASTGSSAGAGTSLWLAFHEDLANPSSPDPVERESTRLTCVVADNGQSSYDPRFAEAAGIPRPNFERHGFFLRFYGIQASEIHTPEAEKRYEEMAPVTHLTADDPPVLMQYYYPNKPVKDANADLGLVVHHPLLGIALQERMEKLGLECVVQYLEGDSRRMIRHGSDQPPVSSIDFIRRHFEAAK